MLLALSSPRARLLPLLLLSWLGALAVACAGAQDRELQGAILIVLDTLRADGLSAYGNARPTSPHLDALAQRGALFEQAFSNASWTLPGFVGLLAGQYPSRRVIDGRLRVSLVDRLQQAGFRTAAFTEGGWVSGFFGLDRGFDEFTEHQGAVRAFKWNEARDDVGIEDTFQLARDWLAAHARDRFFLMLHTYEVHTPYRRLTYASELDRGMLGETLEVGGFPSDVGPTELAYIRALYDGGVHEADRQVGELLETLEELGLASRTLLVVTSDHGEDLGERQPGSAGTHGHTLYGELLRIPLIFHDPRATSPAARIPTQVRLIDVMPTVLELLGVEPPSDGGGRSLAPLLRGEPEEHRVAYGQLLRGQVTLLKETLRDGSYALIRNAFPSTPPFELFDLANDPAELRNVADERAEQREALTARLREVRSDALRDGTAVFWSPSQVSEDLRERLEALGYTE